jgi:hypothetical protein
MPKKLYVLNRVATDPSDGFVDADGAKPYIEFDDTTDPLSARLYLPGTQVSSGNTLEISGGEITVPGPGVYVVYPEGYPTIKSDILIKINGCNLGESIFLVVPTGYTVYLDNGVWDASCNIMPPNLNFLTLSQAGGSCIQLMKGLVGSDLYWLVPSMLSSGVLTEVRTFIQTAGAGVYTAIVEIPSECMVLDVRWMNDALWGAATSATLNVGDADDVDGYFAAVDLKAAPIANVNGAGGISCFLKDTGAGAYAGLTKYSSSLLVITATVTVVGTGTGGKSWLTVLYTVGPNVAATKV